MSTPSHPSGPWDPEALTSPAAPGDSTPSAPPGSHTLKPGDILAARYRIVSRLGKGGMGEVYRADDLTLNTSVALKFIPPEVSTDPVRLDRFRAEVRLTRQVSHQNVARVYDINETSDASGPRVFLSMEYIDGEDLASLLRRIGRIPHDKAVEIARQVCFGLAAAHDQGVIHRDLKPANIMLDGRGQARITDFGVAAIATDLARPDSASQRSAGTPAYMAPEQFAGREVSKRSDLYSLGLVLYELFTGKPAFEARTLDDLKRLHDTGTRPASPASITHDLDPAVERTILRCLEKDPADRPPSAIAVAASLPGGDPLAAAIAAGETPSPELVALSGTGAGLSRVVAWTIAALVLIAVAWLGAISDRYAIHRRGPFALPPDVLAAKARDLVRTFTGQPPPAHEAWALSYDSVLIKRFSGSSEPDRWTRVADADPTLIRFWYRAAPNPLIPTGWWEKSIGPWSPPRNGEGLYLALDTTGRLLRYDRGTQDGFRTSLTPAATPSPGAIDWSPFFTAAELDGSALAPAAPRFPPLVPADYRIAWTGPSPRDTQPLFISGAALDGVPVWFDRRPDVPADPSETRPTVDAVLSSIASTLLMLGVLAAVLLARANVKARRGDRAGAWRVALFVGTVEYLAMILPRNSLAAILSTENFGRPLARALWIGIFSWVLYMALEPLVRRAWPQLLISWSRLLTGAWRDPLVARHTLLGLGGGALTSALFASIAILRPTQSGFISGALQPRLGHHLGLRFSLGETLASTAATVALGLILTLLLIGLKLLLKRLWIITPIVAVCFAALFFNPLGGAWPLIIASFTCGGILALLLVREGVLALIAGLLTASVLLNFPLTLDLSAWYSSTALTYSAAFIVLAILTALTATRATPRTA